MAVEQRIEIYEVCNQEYKICPACGVYRGQYHDPGCLVVHQIAQERVREQKNDENDL